MGYALQVTNQNTRLLIIADGQWLIDMPLEMIHPELHETLQEVYITERTDVETGDIIPPRAFKIKIEDINLDEMVQTATA